MSNFVSALLKRLGDNSAARRRAADRLSRAVCETLESRQLMSVTPTIVTPHVVGNATFTAFAAESYVAAAAPSLSINNVSQNEGNSGNTPFVFTVTRSGDTTGSSTVDYSTHQGTATAGSDYIVATGTLNFAAGQTSANITVQVKGDTTVESDETFTVALTNPTNATLDNATGTGTIINDDGAAATTPAVSNFTAYPNSTAGGETITLSASASEVSGTVSTVQFYADTDGTSGLNTSTDKYLGAGTNSDGTWTLVTTTSGFPNGTVTLYAVATDTAGHTGQASTTIGNVTTLPTVTSFAANPYDVVQGQSTTMTATAEEDSGSIANVKFYYSAPTTDTGEDVLTLIGTGTYSNRVWSISFNTSVLSVGQHYINATATDAAGNSATANSTLNVEAPLATPTNVTTTMDDQTSIRLAWSPNGETSFQYQYSTSNTFAYPTTVSAGVSDSFSTFVEGLKPSTTYYFRVRSVSSSGNSTEYSDWSSTATGTTFATGATPGAPTNVTATVGTGTITVKWTAPTGTAATSYIVIRGTDYNFDNYTTFTVNSGTSFVDTTTSASTYYYYKVESVNGSGYGGTSSSVKIKTGKTGGTGTVPDAPNSILGVVDSSKQITLHWSYAGSNQTGFILQRSTTSSFTNVTTFNLAANATTYADTSVTASTTYYYRIASTNAAGTSAYVASDAITTPAASTQTPPTSPTGLAGAANSATQIVLTWNDTSSNETGFEIDRSTSSSFTNATTFTTAANVQTYTDNTVVAGTTYYYRVRAFNNGGNTVSGYSTASPITTPTGAVLAGATNLAGAAVAGPAVSLTWKDNASGETGYDIQVSTVYNFETITKDITVSTANLQAYTVSGLSAKSYYYFRVRAISSTLSLDSPWSSSVKVKTLAT